MYNDWHIPENETDWPLLKFCEGNDRQSDHWHSGFCRWLDNFWSARDFRTCLDIGASIGCTTLPFARRFEKVHSFEMQPDVFECLVKNGKGYKNIEFYNVAVGEMSGEGIYTRPEQGSGHAFVHPYRQQASVANSLDRLEQEGHTGIVTPMICLDDHQWWCVDFIKIDVEGAEQRVLDGARSTIMHHKPMIMVERHCSRNHSDLAVRKRFFEYIRCIGYRIEDIRGADFLLVPDKY